MIFPCDILCILGLIIALALIISVAGQQAPDVYVQVLETGEQVCTENCGKPFGCNRVNCNNVLNSNCNCNCAPCIVFPCQVNYYPNCVAIFRLTPFF